MFVIVQRLRAPLLSSHTRTRIIYKRAREREGKALLIHLVCATRVVYPRKKKKVCGGLQVFGLGT